MVRSEGLLPARQRVPQENLRGRVIAELAEDVSEQVGCAQGVSMR